MAESNSALNILVTGGAEGAGLATVKALLGRGHRVAATACDADGALALRLAGALPVYPDLSRASEVQSALGMTKADVVVHAGPQFYGGLPYASADYAACADQLVAYTAAVVAAAQAHGVRRFVSLSFGYLYESGRGAAVEGDHAVHGNDYAPMLAAEAAVNGSDLSGYIIRCGCLYGGHSADTAALADAIKRSQRLPVGAQAASWLHEDDLASAIIALLESDEEPTGIEMLNAAGSAPSSPDDFAAALAAAIGLSAPRTASDGFLSMFRQKTLRDDLLSRALVIDSSRLRERFGWAPRHDSIESGLEATALVWRMQDAVDPADSYEIYDDKAAEAIEAFAYDVALPEPAAEAEAPAAAETAAAAPTPEPVAAAAPPPSDGPTPWNEDEAKREERRRKALERKAKRAARQAGG